MKDTFGRQTFLKFAAAGFGIHRPDFEGRS